MKINKRLVLFAISLYALAGCQAVSGSSNPTPMVAFGPRSNSLETESAGRLKGLSQTLAGKALNAKRPAAELSAGGR